MKSLLLWAFPSIMGGINEVKEGEGECVGSWKVVSNNLIVRRKWIKGIVWAGRGVTFHTASCHLISPSNSGLICWSSMLQVISIRQTDNGAATLLFITDYCTVHPVPPLHRPLTKDLIEYPSVANLCVFHVVTCKHKPYRNTYRPVFTSTLPMVSTCRCPKTASQTYTKLCAHNTL